MPRRRKKVRLTPEEVLCAIGEYVRRHKDTSRGHRFAYHVTLRGDGGASIEFASPPTAAETEELEAQVRSRREALH
ncbi:MAG TPA: hypothetical protein VFA98_01120 [Thermoanaerobaculia bacterium]|jgi:hypothetical protein|nr:hypothetical protein [Thermoanaerobaculia bacterium]